MKSFGDETPVDVPLVDLADDNDHLITRTKVGERLIYHTGYLAADRHDEEVRERAKTAWGLHVLRYVRLVQQREAANVFTYFMIPLRPITAADCVRAREFAMRYDEGASL